MRVIQFEAAVEQASCDYAESRGYLTRKLQWQGRRGAPDRFFTSPMTGPFLVEFKDTSGKLSAIQRREIFRLVDYGCPTFVIRGFQEFKDLIHELENGSGGGGDDDPVSA